MDDRQRALAIFAKIKKVADQPIDLSAEYLKMTAESKTQTQAQEKQLAAKRQPDVKQTLPLEAYAGDYQNDLYGAAQVSGKGGKLYLKFNDLA